MNKNKYLKIKLFIWKLLVLIIFLKLNYHLYVGNRYPTKTIEHQKLAGSSNYLLKYLSIISKAFEATACQFFCTSSSMSLMRSASRWRTMLSRCCNILKARHSASACRKSCAVRSVLDILGRRRIGVPTCDVGAIRRRRGAGCIWRGLLCLWLEVWPLGGEAALASSAMKIFIQFTFMKIKTS